MKLFKPGASNEREPTVNEIGSATLCLTIQLNDCFFEFLRQTNINILICEKKTNNFT